MPIDRSNLERQLDELGGSSRWWNERELRDLPAILQQHEQIMAVARGKVGRIRFMRRSWLIVVTDRRLLCLRSNRRFGWRQLEFGAEQMRRITLRIGPFRGRVRVQSAGDTVCLLLPRMDAYEVHRSLNMLAEPAAQLAARPGARRVMRRVVDHILAFPAVALEPESLQRRAAPPAPPAPQLTAPQPPHVTERMESLEEETQQLRQQVEFLEQLLRDRQAREQREKQSLLQESGTR
jgi:hypothetical protein